MLERAQPVIFRLSVALLVLVAAWRILSLGLAEYYVEKAIDGDETAANKALSWHGRHPQALYLQASAIAGDNPQLAISHLQKAIRHNPTDGRSVALLALLLLDAGEETRADRLADHAIELMPSYVPVRLKVAEYWVKREQWHKALENWQAILITRPGMGKKIFPVLLQISESAESRPILLEFTKNPPQWWESYYSYVVKKAASLETVISLATMRQASSVKLSAQERKDLVWRLQKD